MDKIKILFLIDQLGKAGTESHLLLLSSFLPAARFDCTIGVLSVSDYQKQMVVSIPIVDLRVNSKWGVRTLQDVIRVARYIRRERFHIVQTHFMDSEFIGTLATRLFFKRPRLVVTRRNNYYWIDDQPWMFKIIKRTRHLADHVLVNSVSVKEACRRIEGAADDAISVIYNAVDTSLYDPYRFPDAKRELGLDDRSPVVGVVANSRPVKGLFDFFEGARIVHAAIPSATFVHVGSGPLDDRLRARTDELGLSSCVRFLGSREDVYRILPAFDVAVLPSHSEGFSNALIEYMAAGRAVVATNVGDAAQVVENGSDGFLVPPREPQLLSEKIIELIANPDRAVLFGKRAREKAIGLWSIPKVSEQYQRFYERLLTNLLPSDCGAATSVPQRTI